MSSEAFCERREREHEQRPTARLQWRIHQILEILPPDDPWSRWINASLIILIVLNVLALVVSTVDRVQSVAPQAFWWFELISVSVFTIEYLARIWAATASPKYASSTFGRIRFALTPVAAIDLLAVLPFYLPFLTIDMRFLRLLRIMRIARVLKLGRYSTAMQSFSRAFFKRKEELVAASLVLVVLLLVASSLMYFAEFEAQPTKFSSIPATMWWGVVTLTTVGYGDIYPVTAMGRFLGGIVAVLGIGMFALPTGILGAAFVEELQARRERTDRRCPHCGLPLPEEPH